MTSRRWVDCLEAGSGGEGTAAGWPRPAGWRVLVPGLPQWGWGQRPRGAVLFGSFVTAAAVGAFTWGTATGLGLLVFAFVGHVVSAVDAWNQAAFPPLGRWVPWLTATVWLAFALYVPVLVAASLLAWPGVCGGGPASEGYLVNCWAYRQALPRPGDWVWFRPTARGHPRLGRILAGSGHEVEWLDNQLRVDGRPVPPPLPTPFRPAEAPRSMAYRIPEGHVLINPEGGGQRPASGLVILECDRVVGRAWAQFYPVLERRLLD